MRKPLGTRRRLLTLGPDNESRWVRVYLQEIEGRWAAMLVADGVVPPGPGEVKGLSFFADMLRMPSRRRRRTWGCRSPRTEGACLAVEFEAPLNVLERQGLSMWSEGGKESERRRDKTGKAR